ncbi:MAG: alpha-mannosidase [Clostridiales bacterium]|nr:alpha-mannosidase [Clostridiales bacterium]
MDKTIIRTYLQRLAGRAASPRMEVGGWSYRVANHLAPERYEYLTDWQPLTGAEILPAGKTILLATDVTLPDDLADGDLVDCLALRVACLEGYLRVDGEVYAGIDRNRDRIPLRPEWRGRTLRLEVEAFARELSASRPGEAPHFEYCRLVRCDRRIEALYYDLALLFDALYADEQIVERYSRSLPAAQQALTNARTDFTKPQMMRAMDEALRYLDLALPGDDFVAAAGRSRKTLRERLAAIDDGDVNGVVSLVGHTHVDVAWLWQLKDTVRKCGHTFANMLRLMEEYPDFTFTCSQPLLYAYVKRYYPELYAQLKARFDAGQWEFVGPMWVESDCNVTSGESLIRQLLHGSRFMEREFGVASDICWLPDTFGFQANLPQILRKSGVDAFYSYKLHWQAATRFPYGSFVWKGIDGSSVTAAVPELFNGYNGQVTPAQVKYAMDQNLQKGGDYATGYVDDVIFTYGWGDGGGGPTREMIEYASRMADYPMLPRCRTVRAKEYFDQLKARSDSLPVWYGEMSLETHRGTYTTHGEGKRANRKLEILLQSVEKLTSLAGIAGIPADDRALRQAWETALTLQFHDILPGSSVHAVYDDARRMYAEAFAQADGALAALAASLARPAEGAVTLFNPLSFAVTRLVSLPADKPAHVVDERGQPVPGSWRDGEVCFLAADMPALGVRRFTLAPGEAPDEGGGARVEQSAGGLIVETARLRAAIAADGSLTSLIDRRAGREVLAGPANRLDMYLDGPQGEDAWNLYREYRGRRVDVPWRDEVRLVENSALRTVVRVTRQSPGTVVEQDIVLSDFLDRIEFCTRVDWRERGRLLKVRFPLDIAAPYASCDTGLGTFTRPTNANTPYDQQRFEVVAHKWVDLSEGDYGAAVLNDGKYGHSIEGNEIEISLLRSTSSPDESADLGEHRIDYALYPHAGACAQAQVQRQGHDFNTPLLTLAGDARLDTGLSVDGDALILDTLKPAWDGDGYILRAYEANGTRGAAAIRLPKGASICRCDLMERDQTPAAPADSIDVRYSPYEIITHRLRL